jgi:hypothetical protein
MTYVEHEKLIKSLEEKVKEGPPSTGFAEPYFKRCWALIKKIGPSFKETLYPNRPEREARWKRFQSAVDTLKDQQKQWEAVSEKTQLALLELIEKGRPIGYSMGDLLGPTPGAVPSPAVETGSEANPASLSLSKREQLDALTAACDAALARFMEAKGQLSHSDFKVVSAKLADVRKQLQRAWDEYKKIGRSRAEERKTGQADENSPWRKKQVKYLNKLKDSLANEEALLSNKQGALASFQKELKTTKDAAVITRNKTWIADCEEIIPQLETSIASFKTQIAAVEKQLSLQQPE